MFSCPCDVPAVGGGESGPGYPISPPPVPDCPAAHDVFFTWIWFVSVFRFKLFVFPLFKKGAKRYVIAGFNMTTNSKSETNSANIKEKSKQQDGTSLLGAAGATNGSHWLILQDPAGTEHTDHVTCDIFICISSRSSNRRALLWKRRTWPQAICAISFCGYLIAYLFRNMRHAGGYYLRIENAEGYVLIAVYLFVCVLFA